MTVQMEPTNKPEPMTFRKFITELPIVVWTLIRHANFFWQFLPTYFRTMWWAIRGDFRAPMALVKLRFWANHESMFINGKPQPWLIEWADDLERKIKEYAAKGITTDARTRR